jgi:hypothetical protein
MWSGEWISAGVVKIACTGEGGKDFLDVTFRLAQENLGDFLSYIFDSGYNFSQEILYGS